MTAPDLVVQYGIAVHEAEWEFKRTFWIPRRVAVAVAVDCARPHRTRRDMPDILRSFWHPGNMKYRSPILAWLAQILLAVAVFAQPEAGPESGGLQLRLVVLPHFQAGKEGYEVRLDLINATKEDVRLRAGWLNENDKGDVKDYIEAATSIETHPPIAPWAGQVVMPHRESPQPEYVLKAGKVLPVGWVSDGRRLKNRVADQIRVQNPEFPFPGMYSVHATLKIDRDDRTVLLRSNEQLVSTGGSRESPKHTYGQLEGVDADAKTATLSLGALHKIDPGDEFQIRTGMFEVWRLTISQIAPEYSMGRLEPLPRVGQNPVNPNPRFPERYMNATLIPKK
jgi:hypothetical protein